MGENILEETIVIDRDQKKDYFKFLISIATQIFNLLNSSVIELKLNKNIDKYIKKEIHKNILNCFIAWMDLNL